MTARPEAFFLSVDISRTGQRFCIFHPAQGAVTRGAILYIHPFAEEMNKSRRMAALQSRALSEAGFAVLQIDLLGCGDSSGDFGDATWLDWVDDVVQGCNWLAKRTARSHGGQDVMPLWLWGMRAGCLLAAEAATRLDKTANFLFWQPAPAGKHLLQQFLRLKAAGGLMDGTAKGVTEGLRQQLAAGERIEVAGYAVSPGMANGIQQSTLLPPTIKLQRRSPTASVDQPALVAVASQLSVAPARLEWFEISSRDDASLSPVASKTISEWSDAGFAARSHLVNGPSFWQTTEIEDAPALVTSTVAAIAPRHEVRPVTA